MNDDRASEQRDVLRSKPVLLDEHIPVAVGVVAALPVAVGLVQTALRPVLTLVDWR